MRQIIEQKPKVRIGKKSLAALPADVAAAIRDIQDGYPNIKSFDFIAVGEAHDFYAGEGYKFRVIAGEADSSVEMVAEHNIGGSGMSHKIGETFKAPVGAFVLEISYYTKYWLRVYNVQPAPIAEAI